MDTGIFKLRPALLIVALLAGIGVFVWVLLAAPPAGPRAGGFDRSTDPGLRELYAAKRWDTLYDAAESQARSDNQTRRLWGMLFRAWASEKIDPTPAESAPPDAATLSPDDAWLALRAELDTIGADEPAPASFDLRRKVNDAYMHGWAAHGAGDAFEAQRRWREAAELQRAAADEAPVGEDAYLLSNYLALIGEADEAVNWLARAHAGNWIARTGLNAWIRVDPDLDPIRNHPRYDLALAVGTNFGASIRRLLADGREADAVWFAQQSAAASNTTETWHFTGMLLARSEDPADQQEAERAFRVLLSLHKGLAESEEGAATLSADLIVGLPRPEEIGFINTAHEIGWALRGLGREEAARSYFGVYVARMAAERTQIEAEAALQSDSDGSFSSAFMGGLLGTTCYNLACGHALVGDADSALEALRAATRYGYADTQWATVDPDLDSLDRAALAEALGIGFGTNPASAE